MATGPPAVAVQGLVRPVSAGPVSACRVLVGAAFLGAALAAFDATIWNGTRVVARTKLRQDSISPRPLQLTRALSPLIPPSLPRCCRGSTPMGCLATARGPNKLELHIHVLRRLLRATIPVCFHPRASRPASSGPPSLATWAPPFRLATPTLPARPEEHHGVLERFCFWSLPSSTKRLDSNGL